MRILVGAGLALTLLCLGCPARQREQPPPARNTPPTVSAPDPGDGSPEAIPPLTTPGAAGTLDLDGLRLGMSYDAAKAITEESGHRLTSGLWVDTKGRNGLLMLTSAEGAKLPADDLFFVEGKLVGYFKRLEMTAAEFDSGIKFHTALYGEPLDALPGWASGAVFFNNMPALKAPARRVFWQSEAGQELLVAQYDPATRRALFGLLRPAACDELGVTYDDQLAAFDHPVSAPRTPPNMGGAATPTSGKTG